MSAALGREYLHQAATYSPTVKKAAETYLESNRSAKEIVRLWLPNRGPFDYSFEKKCFLVDQSIFPSQLDHATLKTISQVHSAALLKRFVEQAFPLATDEDKQNVQAFLQKKLTPMTDYFTSEKMLHLMRKIVEKGNILSAADKRKKHAGVTWEI